MYLWDGDKLVGHGPENALVLDVPGDDVDAHVVSINQFGAGTSRRFYHQGPDQSTIALSDDGGFVEGYSYSAFGEASVWTRGGQQPSDNIFRYQGQVFDVATGTCAMRARQYRPDWGRFVSPDPLSTSAGPSVYAFTNSRPLHHRDPSGMLTTGGAGVDEAWLRAWMNSWDTPFGTPPWFGGFGGGGRDLAQTWSFGSGMGDMASLFYGRDVWGSEFPWSSSGGFWPHLDTVNGSVRLVDTNGYLYAFEKPKETEMHADVPLYAGPGWWKAAMEAGRRGEAAVRAIADIGKKAVIELENGQVRIPDGLNEETETLNEVKNVDYQAFTQQLRDMWEWAKANGYQMTLWMREGSDVAAPLEELEEASGGQFQIVYYALPLLLLF